MSHRSAAALWDLLPVSDGPTDVIVDGTGGRAPRTGIRVHRAISLVAAEVTLRHGVPVTSPSRTISDIRRASERRAGKRSAWELRKALRQANVLGLPIDAEDRADRTRSDLEADFLAICRRHRLPRPEVNVRVGPFLVDFLWRSRRLVVETDSYLYHRGKAAFQDDRGRGMELTRVGYRVLQLSEQQIDAEPSRVAEAVAAALADQDR